LLPAGGLVKKGGKIAFTVRAPLLGSGKRNLFKLHRMGQGNLRADRGASPPRATTRKGPASVRTEGEAKVHNFNQPAFTAPVPQPQALFSPAAPNRAFS